jgi:hypothetical protein
LVGGDFIEFNESTRNHFICLWNQTLWMKSYKQNLTS